MRIGIIGAGGVGSTLGRGWSKAGHEVVFGVRDPTAAPPFAVSTVATVRAAVEAAEVLVLATPWAAVGDALDRAGDLGGRVLIDATNPIGPGFTLALGHTTSGGERVAELARNTRVVKGFNSNGVETMADAVFGAHRGFMPLAGDDPAARETVARLASDLGFEPVALPGLAHARTLEPLALLWIKLALQLGHGRNIAFGLARRASAGAAVAAPARRSLAITVAGGGHIGGALARAWLRAGHRVRIAARDADSDEVRALVSAGATAHAVEGAAAGAEVVVLAVPAGAAIDVAKQLGELDGKVVIDCTNAIAKGFTLAYGHQSSSRYRLRALESP